MRKAFTLIEIIVVIAVIGVLAAIITPNALKAIKKAQVAKTVADMKSLKTALLNYYADTGRFPDPFYFRANGYGHRNATGASYSFTYPPVIANEDGAVNWNGPYLDNIHTSPLIHSYVSGGFTYPGTYWIGGTNIYQQSFDLDDNGSADITNAVSIQLAGLELADALAIDNAFDNDGGRVGRHGIMNVTAGSGYYYIYLYVGTGPCGIGN